MSSIVDTNNKCYYDNICWTLFVGSATVVYVNTTFSVASAHFHHHSHSTIFSSTYLRVSVRRSLLSWFISNLCFASLWSSSVSICKRVTRIYHTEHSHVNSPSFCRILETTWTNHTNAYKWWWYPIHRQSRPPTKWRVPNISSPECWNAEILIRHISKSEACACSTHQRLHGHEYTHKRNSRFNTTTHNRTHAMFFRKWPTSHWSLRRLTSDPCG